MSDPFLPFIKKIEKVEMKPSKTKKFVLGGIFGVVVVGLAIWGGRIAWSGHTNLVTPEVMTIRAVGALVALPIGETPTIATITDLNPLKGQEFFKEATLGDKVLIFSKSKKAILYNPNINKIISIAPIQ